LRYNSITTKTKTKYNTRERGEERRRDERRRDERRRGEEKREENGSREA